MTLDLYKAVKTYCIYVILTTDFYPSTAPEYLFLLASEFPEIYIMIITCPLTTLLCEMGLSPFSTSISEKEKITKNCLPPRRGLPNPERD